jgi:hypothetical protein
MIFSGLLFLVDYDQMTKEQKIQSFYKKIGLSSLKNIYLMTKKPYAFKAFGVNERDTWREQSKKYKLKKHSGKTYGYINKQIKKRINANE